MKLVPMICPSCNASLEVDGTREFVYCQYCGTRIYLDKEVDFREVVHVYRDEARLKEIEIREREKREAEEREKIERLTQAQALKAKTNRFLMFAIIGVLISVAIALFWYNDNRVFIMIIPSIMTAIFTPVVFEEGKEMRGYLGLFVVYFMLYNFLCMMLNWIFVK